MHIFTNFFLWIYSKNLTSYYLACTVRDIRNTHPCLDMPWDFVNIPGNLIRHIHSRVVEIVMSIQKFVILLGMSSSTHLHPKSNPIMYVFIFRFPLCLTYLCGRMLSFPSCWPLALQHDSLSFPFGRLLVFSSAAVLSYVVGWLPVSFASSSQSNSVSLPSYLGSQPKLDVAPFILGLSAQARCPSRMRSWDHYRCGVSQKGYTLFKSSSYFYQSIKFDSRGPKLSKIGIVLDMHISPC